MHIAYGSKPTVSTAVGTKTITNNSMPGEGFLRQGIESAKYNRDLLSKKGHTPFERKETGAQKKEPVRDDKKLSAAQRYSIHSENYEFNRSEIRKRLIAALVAILVLMIGLYFLMNLTF